MMTWWERALIAAGIAVAFAIWADELSVFL